jgi:hypothetical protein
MKIKDLNLEDYIYSLNIEYNENIYEATGQHSDDCPYSYTSNGFSYVVEFLGRTVFCSENDSEYDDSNNIIVAQTIMKNVTKVMTDIFTHSKSGMFSNPKWYEHPLGGE